MSKFGRTFKRSRLLINNMGLGLNLDKLSLTPYFANPRFEDSEKGWIVRRHLIVTEKKMNIKLYLKDEFFNSDKGRGQLFCFLIY